MPNSTSRRRSTSKVHRVPCRLKTKSAIDDLAEGAILEVVATDPGSMSDIDGWAAGTDGVELVDQEEGDDVYRHYVRKTE